MESSKGSVFLLLLVGFAVSGGQLNGTERGGTFKQEAPDNGFFAASSSFQEQVLPDDLSPSVRVAQFVALDERTGQAEPWVQVQATVPASTAADLLSRAQNGADASERSSSSIDGLIANDPRGADRVEVVGSVPFMPDWAQGQSNARPAGKGSVGAEERGGSEVISSAGYNEADVVEEEEVPEDSNDGLEESNVASRQVLNPKGGASLPENGDVEIEEEEEELSGTDEGAEKDAVKGDMLPSEEETLAEENKENLGDGASQEGVVESREQDVTVEQQPAENSELNNDALSDNDKPFSHNSVQDVISHQQQDDTVFQEEESKHEGQQEVSNEDVTSEEQVSKQEEGVQFGLWKGRSVQTQLSSAQKKAVAEQQEKFLQDFYKGNKRPGNSNSSGDGQLEDDDES